MLTRIRIATGLALTALLATTIVAFAKGGFDFIMISGPNLKEPMRLTDPRLTADFFTFANFYENKTQAPADAGTGYEITRHYVQGVSDIVFDRLHYYPETGFVFYDGIENGESEYDGEWYIADPQIKSIWEGALSLPSTGELSPGAQTPPVYLALLGILGLALLSLFTYRVRKSLPR